MRINRHTENALRSGDIITLTVLGNISRSQLIVLTFRKPRVRNNQLLQIENHHPKRVDHVRFSIEKPTVLNLFGSTDRLVFHISDIRQFVISNHINITIYIAYNQRVICIFMINLHNIHIRKSLHF